MRSSDDRHPVGADSGAAPDCSRIGGFGVRRDDMAAYVEVDPKTMRKHFRVELDRGTLEATAAKGALLQVMHALAALEGLRGRGRYRPKVT